MKGWSTKSRPNRDIFGARATNWETLLYLIDPQNTSAFLPSGDSSSYPVGGFLVSCASGPWWQRCRTPARRWRGGRPLAAAAVGTVSPGGLAWAEPDLVWRAVSWRYWKSSVSPWWSYGSSCPLQLLWLVEMGKVQNETRLADAD